MAVEGMLCKDIIQVGQVKSPTFNACAKRFLKANRQWVENRLGDFDKFVWIEHAGDIHMDELLQVFSFDEVVDIWTRFNRWSLMDQHIDKTPETFLLWKVQNSFWNFGSGRNGMTCAQLRNTLASLQKLDQGLPENLAQGGFEIRVTHTRAFNPQGSAQHVNESYLWLDAPFALLLYFRGKHVLTVSFGVGYAGVFVTQVQLRTKRGNRFLYHLGQHYLDFALGLISKAFQGQPLWLLDGKSAVEAIQKSYGTQPCSMTPEDGVRIQAFYDRPLANFTRTCEDFFGPIGRKYWRITNEDHP